MGCLHQIPSLRTQETLWEGGRNSVRALRDRGHQETPLNQRKKSHLNSQRLRLHSLGLLCVLWLPTLCPGFVCYGSQLSIFMGFLSVGTSGSPSPVPFRGHFFFCCFILSNFSVVVFILLYFILLNLKKKGMDGWMDENQPLG